MPVVPLYKTGGDGNPAETARLAGKDSDQAQMDLHDTLGIGRGGGKRRKRQFGGAQSSLCPGATPGDGAYTVPTFSQGTGAFTTPEQNPNTASINGNNTLMLTDSQAAGDSAVNETLPPGVGLSGGKRSRRRRHRKRKRSTRGKKRRKYSRRHSRRQET